MEINYSPKEYIIKKYHVEIQKKLNKNKSLVILKNFFYKEINTN